MKAIKTMEKATLPKLLKTFEGHIDVINQSRAKMFKIVSIIDTRNLFSKKSNYNKRQLKILADKGIKQPWNETTRTVLMGLYSNFSWAQYVKFGRVSQQIEMETAKRLSEDALILLNKNRENIAKINPKLRKVKGQITKKEVETIIGKKPVKRAKKPVVIGKPKTIGPALKAKDKEITRLQNALERSLDLNAQLNNEIKDLRKRLRKYE